MSPRSFLEGLAYKVFCSTQFIRSENDIDFSPLPDILHETLGHATTLSCEKFSEMA
jgi:phenylalanine-4-hydroxylase